MSNLALSISLSRKVNLGNYQSADVFVSVSGVTTETTPEEIGQMIDEQGALAYSKIKAALKAKIEDIANG